FQTGTYNRGFSFEQGNCLALHVGAHQCPVSIIVFQEWNQGRRNRHDLVWSHVHITDFLRLENGEVTLKTGLHPVVDECTIVIQGGICLGDVVLIFLLCSQEHHIIQFHTDLPIRSFTVGSLKESHPVHFGVNTQ